MLRGEFAGIDPETIDPDKPVLFYSHPSGEIWVGDVVAWLGSLESESVDLVFADPPYNIKKAEWDTFESQQAYVAWSLQWIEQVARVLKPNGTVESHKVIPGKVSQSRTGQVVAHHQLTPSRTRER